MQGTVRDYNCSSGKLLRLGSMDCSVRVFGGTLNTAVMIDLSDTF